MLGLRKRGSSADFGHRELGGPPFPGLPGVPVTAERGNGPAATGTDSGAGAAGAFPAAERGRRARARPPLIGRSLAPPPVRPAAAIAAAAAPGGGSAFGGAPASAAPPPPAALEMRRPEPAPAAPREVVVEAPPAIDEKQLQQALSQMPQLHPDKLADQVYKALMKRMKLEQRLRGY